MVSAISKIKCAALGAILAAALSVSASAQLVSQAPDLTGADGWVSDAVPGQFYDERAADDFVIPSSSVVTGVRFWGFSENYPGGGFPDYTNMASFTVVIFADAGGVPGAVVFSQNFPAAATGPVAVGTSTATAATIFQQEVTFGSPAVLTAGTYWLSIGSVAVAPGEDAWIWNQSDPQVNSLTQHELVVNSNNWVTDITDTAFELLGSVANGGRCTAPNGTCTVTTAAICGAAGGTFDEGSQTCPPTGGCTAPDGTCSVRFEANCTFIGGTYLGDNQSCPPTGRCCRPAQVCDIRFEANCANVGGAWGGANTNCDSSLTFSNNTATPIPDGNPTGITSSIVVGAPDVISSVSVELNINHTWMGDLSATLTFTPNVGSPVSVDLFRRVGGPPMSTYGQNTDLVAGNVYLFTDAGPTDLWTACGVNAAAPATLAAGSFFPSTNDGVSTTFPPNGAHTSLNAASPVGFGGLAAAGTWTLTVSDAELADTGTLNSWKLRVNGGGGSPCPPDPTGSCCLTNGSCQVLTAAACTATGGVSWASGGACQPNDCASIGACCSGITCTGGVTQAVCQGGGGIYLGNNTTCTPNNCLGACCHSTPLVPGVAVRCDGPVSLATCNTYAVHNFQPSQNCTIVAGPPHTFCCPGNFNQDDVKNVADIFFMLTAWFQHLPAANWDGSGPPSVFTVSDIFSFLASWFQPC